MIANPNGIFNNSRIVLFAGGTVFSDINGTSRFIIDKQAFDQLRKYYLNHSNWQQQTLKSYTETLHIKNIARAFMAMLAPQYFRPLRDQVFTSFNERLLVIALAQDQVFPPDDIIHNFEKSGVRINKLDFPYKYSHETPFPVSADPLIATNVDKCFDNIFKEAGAFLKG